MDFFTGTNLEVTQWAVEKLSKSRVLFYAKKNNLDGKNSAFYQKAGAVLSYFWLLSQCDLVKLSEDFSVFSYSTLLARVQTKGVFPFAIQLREFPVVSSCDC